MRLLVAVLLLTLTSCKVDTKSQAQKAASEPGLIHYDFNEFFEQFKKAIIEKDSVTLMSLVIFPLETRGPMDSTTALVGVLPVSIRLGKRKINIVVLPGCKSGLTKGRSPTSLRRLGYNQDRILLASACVLLLVSPRMAHANTNKGGTNRKIAYVQ